MVIVGYPIELNQDIFMTIDGKQVHCLCIMSALICCIYTLIIIYNVCLVSQENSLYRQRVDILLAKRS
jgi:hypothetical protein